MSKGNPRFTIRLTRKETLAIHLLARRDNKPVAVYLRLAIKEHLRGVAVTQSLGGSHLETLVTLTKEFIVRAQLARQTPTKVPMKAEKGPQLPGTEKRGELEELTWKVLQTAVDVQ